MRAALALIAVLVLFTEPARAGIVHTLRYSAPPVVRFWPAPSPIADGEARFAVASNTGFAICVARADAGVLAASDLAPAGFSLAHAGTGPNAAAVGAPVISDTPAGPCVFQSPARTAARPGTPESQALHFVAAWAPGAFPGGLTFAAHPREADTKN